MFFHRRVKIDKNLITSMRPTSKASLKQMCLLVANGDLEKAQKLYEYMIKDMDDLPLFDIPEPTRMEQVKQGFGDVMKWLSQNQEEIFVWADLLRGFFNKGGNNGGASPLVGSSNNISNNIPNIN